MSAQAPDGFVYLERGAMRLYLRRTHAEALLGIQVQRVGEWLSTHHWARLDGGRGSVALLRPGLSDGSGLVIKGYRHGGVLGGLLGSRYRSPLRALRAIEASDAARRAGVPAPLILAGAAERSFPFGYRLYEVSAEVTGAEPLQKALGIGVAAGPVPPLPRGVRSRRRLLVEACARSIRAVHDAGVDHRDLNLTNLLAVEGPSGPTVQIVDYDGAEIGPPLSPGRRLRALRRLYRSFQKIHPLHSPPPPLAQGRFLRAYCGENRTLQLYLVDRRRSFSRRAGWHRLLWRRPGRTLPRPR